MFCPNCGKKIDDASIFCEFCGEAISKVKEENIPKSDPVKKKEDGTKSHRGLLVLLTIVIVIVVAAAVFAVGVTFSGRINLTQILPTFFSEEEEMSVPGDDDIIPTSDVEMESGTLYAGEMNFEQAGATLSADELVGTWGVNRTLTGQNNLFSLRGTFGVSIENGAEFVFEQDGSCSWYFTDRWGGEGTYIIDNGAVNVSYTDADMGEKCDIVLYVVPSGEDITLELDTLMLSGADEYTIFWSKGASDSLSVFTDGDDVQVQQITSNNIEEQTEDEDEQNDLYILPESDSRYYEESELRGLTQEECKLARNEIYARHGRKFNDQELQDYFNSLEWYTPSIDPDDFQEAFLNEYETANRDLIVEYEKKQGYR